MRRPADGTLAEAGSLKVGLQLRGLAAAQTAPPDWLAPALHSLQGIGAQGIGGRAPPAVVLHLAAPATEPEAGPLHWALVDGDGRWLCQQRPLLDAITRGQGLQLRCLQRGSDGQWRLRRAVHLAAPAAYGLGRRRLAAALQALLAQAWIDAGTQLTLTSDPLPPPQPAPTLTAVPRWSALLQGRWRHLRQRQRARWLSESWRIGVIEQPVASLLAPGALPPVRWLTDRQDAGYWADPQGLPGSQTDLVCEYFDYRSGLGRIEQLGLRPAAAPLRTGLPVGNGSHVSFPQVFELDGRRLGIAETMAERCCWLHTVDASGAWHRLCPLLQDTAAADPTLLRWQGRYWLAYTDADLGEQDNLCLHHADHLEGPWLAHANNPVKRDICGARMAGRFFESEGLLYRPGQDCLDGYGSAVVVHRVTELSPTRFEEHAVRRLTPDPHDSHHHGLHTLNAWGDRTLIDSKRLAFVPRLLLRKLGSRGAGRGPYGRAWPAAGQAGHPGHGGHGGKAAIFVYVPHLRTGGGEVSMLQLAAGFAAAGRDVTLVVHTRRTQELPLPPGVKLLSLDREGTAAAWWPLVRALREQRPQWLLSAFPHTNIAAVLALLLARSGTRGAVSEHAPLTLQIDQQANWRYRLLPRLVRWVYPFADAVVAVSEGVRRDLQAIAGPALAPHVIANPVLPPDFETEAAREPDHPWLQDRQLQVVLSVCRLAVEKDLPTLLKAFADVHRLRPDARLILAGEGPERQHLQALVAQLQLQAVVALPGRTGQALRWMRHARVFVLPSRFEGFGNVLIEALACGTPVVSTDCPVGPRELLDGGRHGALVPVGDAGAMARAIAAALDNPQPPPGAQAAALRYTRAAACDAYLRLFDQGAAAC